MAECRVASIEKAFTTECITFLMQLAETRGDDLRAEILQSTVDLEKTTDRAKEYERSKTSMIDITDLPKTEACHTT